MLVSRLSGLTEPASAGDTQIGRSFSATFKAHPDTEYPFQSFPPFATVMKAE
jgi:hypothetical protein